MNFRYWVGVIALAAVTASGAAQATNLVTNGDFTNGLTSWTSSGWNSGVYDYTMNFGPAAVNGCGGTACVDTSKIGTGAAYLSQTITDTAKASYILQFTYKSSVGSNTENPSELKVLWDGSVISDLVNVPVSYPVSANTYDYLIVGTGTDKLTFLGRQDQSLLEVGSVSVSPVPLPGALPLFASAIAGVAGFGMRTRCRKAA